MSINFCNIGLARLESQHPSSDEHSLSNLISLNPDLRNKGFIAGHFVKPPVQVDVNFCCAVNLERIVVKCVVGSQKSTMIQIVSVNANSSEKVIAWDSLSSNENTILFHKCGRELGVNTSSTKYSTLKNGLYLCKVKTLKLRILRTESSTVPALGALEIWGNVSKIESNETLNCVRKIWEKINTPKYPVKTNEEVSKGNDNSSNSCSNKDPTPSLPKDLEIPEEFLDPITWNILTLPMTLPCGKIVDLSTLEKFYNAEKEWGRGRSDPFTGVPFSKKRKPVVNAALKSRLDKFLLEHCDNPAIKNLPRTLGKKTFSPPVAEKKAAPYAPSSSASGTTPTTGIKRARDVDSLLESALSGLPSFLEKPVVKKDKNDCIKCDSKTYLFKLKCGHLLCRSCLSTIKGSNNSICVCSAKFDFKTIERYHTSII